MSARAMKDIQDLEREAKVATSVLQWRASDVRANTVNWQSYLQAQMISREVYEFISKFDKTTPENRAALINQNPLQFVAVFRSLMDRIAKDQTLQYILTMLDDALQEDQGRVEFIREFARKRKESVWQPFFQLLERSDQYIVYQSSRIIAKIACWCREPMEKQIQQRYITWLKDHLRTDNEYNITVARCLQMMLRIDNCRRIFVDIDGISVIAAVLPDYEKVGFQLVYQLVFCLWCLTFNPELTDRMNRWNLIPVLTEVFAGSQRAKVKRIVLALFRHMLEKAEDNAVIQDFALAMIRSKVSRHLEMWNTSDLYDDDITDDITWVIEKLEASVQDLSSYDEYVSELKSGSLEWSPAHTSDRFWGENAIRFNENNYELLRILVRLLETSRDPLVLSVAAHDIGEYVRLYPRGKNILEQLGAKQRIMLYLSHEDPNVRYQSLLALQKLMVHNWEYVGRKVKEEQSSFGRLLN